MAIYTPRGLKIRIAVPYAFGLMTRLHPKVSPFRVLKTTEGIERLPGMLASLAGIMTFVTQLPPLQIGLAVGGAQLAGALINLFGCYVIPGLVSAGTLFSYIAGYGIFFMTILVVGLLLVGWQGVLAFFVGKVVIAMIIHVLQYWRTSRYHKVAGYPFTPSEVHFFNAYRLHASRIGVTTDIDLEDAEMQEDNWGPTFEEFATRCPQVVARFTTD